MTVTIYVNENRTFSGVKKGLSLGTVSENDVTDLKFILPQSLRYLTIRYILLETSLGIQQLYLDDKDSVTLDHTVTTDESVRLQLVLMNSTDVWKSAVYDATFYESLDTDTSSVLDELKKQWTAEAQRPLTILVNRVTEKVTELLSERRNKI